MGTALAMLLLISGCMRTAYPNALLVSQEACAQLYRDCGEAAKVGTPCVRLPPCPMASQTDVGVGGPFRDLGWGWPYEK